MEEIKTFFTGATGVIGTFLLFAGGFSLNDGKAIGWLELAGCIVFYIICGKLSKK